MLIKLDMTVLEHDLIQSQVVMLLENKLMVYLLTGGVEDVHLMSSEKEKNAWHLWITVELFPIQCLLQIECM